MKTLIFLVFTYLFSLTSRAQHFSLEEIQELSSSSPKEAVNQIKKHGWGLLYSRIEIGNPTYTFERLNQEVKTKEYIQLKDKGKFNSLVISVREKPVFDSLKTTARKQGFKDLYYKVYRYTSDSDSATDSAFLKDSSLVLIFRTSGDEAKGDIAYEIVVDQFRNWITSLIMHNAKTVWNEAALYRYMLKCIGERNTPAELMDMTAICSCGEGILETKNNIDTVLALSRRRLIDMIENCFILNNVKPY